MKTTTKHKVTFLALAFLCWCLFLNRAMAAPRVLWQNNAPIEIPIGETPQAVTLQLSEFSLGKDEIAAVRFSVFFHSDHPSGWNHFLAVDVNGKAVTEQTPDHTPRLLNHSRIFHTSHPTEDRVPYFGTLAGRSALNTFFLPSADVLEPRLLDNKTDAAGYVLNVNDLLQPGKTNQITFTNLAIQKYFKGRANPNSVLVISNLKLMAVSKQDAAQMKSTFMEHRSALAGPHINGGESELTATPGGGLQLDINGEKYFWESTFSYPGEKIGWDKWLCQPESELTREEGENGWKATISTTNKNTVMEISSQGNFFSLKRQVKWDGNRYLITDTVTNLTGAPLGFLRHDNVIGETPWTDYRMDGQRIQTTPERRNADNPTLFLGQNKSAVGVLLENTLMRLQWGGELENNRANIIFSHNGLKPHASRSYQWCIYPQQQMAKSTFNQKYFDFINAVRDDWKTNFTVPGPFDYYYPPTAAQEKDPSLHAFSLPGQTEDQYLHDEIARKGVKIFALNPWFDYYYPEMPWADFKTMMQARIKKIKAAEPDAKCIACIETNLTRIPMSFFGDTVPADIPWGRPGDTPPIGKSPGNYHWPAPPAMEKKVLDSPWRDSVIVGKEGKVLLDTWYVEKYDGKDLNFKVYPTTTNYWNQQMLKKIRFLLDDVGFDGLYIDQFTSAGNPGDEFTYNQWDGATVDIDPTTGKVTRQYSNIPYLTTDARRGWVEEALKRGKIVVVNGEPAVTEMQSLPIMRFMETGNYDVSVPGAPEANNVYKGQLGTPIGLGYQWTAKAQEGGAKLFNRSVIANLKYGMLYYYYTTRFPEDGPLGGEFGPVKNMFPLTPVELGEGFIIGKERIVTCVSRVFLWPHALKPKVLLFDESGRKVLSDSQKIAITKEKSGWNVSIHLRDWYQIAIIE
jgi:hypothetical protein